ncbi:hypothetical protein JW877_05930 [bacterium]|nr:hypothetical protein [bacterium]
MNKNYLTSSLLGGLVLGLLSSIPYLNMGNIFCCLWVVLGGALAAYLFWGESKRITSGQGAFAGFLAGMWGALVSAILNTVMWTFLSETYMSKMFRIFQDQDIPAESMEIINRIFQGNPVIIGAITLVSNLIINAIFATLGGLICAAILKKKNPPVVINVQQPPQPPQFPTEPPRE